MTKEEPKATPRPKIITLELTGKTVYCFPAKIKLTAKRTDKTTTP